MFYIRFLEWDYGSDLGYVESQVTQVQAAQSLSTLEKLAIGNYSEFLKESDQPDLSHPAGRINLGLPDTFDQQTDIKMRTFADSLMRQRRLREMQVDDHSKPNTSWDQDPNLDERRRGQGWEKHSTKMPTSIDNSQNKITENSNLRTDPRSLPMIYRTLTTRSTSDVISSPEKKMKSKVPHIRRSASMTDVYNLSNARGSKPGFVSNTQLAGPRVSQGSGPSSSSSCATVVNSRRTKAEASLRPEEDGQVPNYLKDVFVETDRDAEHLQLSKLSVRSRQSSKRSDSFETVVGMDKYPWSGKDSIDTDEEHLSGELRDQVQEECKGKRNTRHAWNDKSSEERDFPSLPRRMHSGNSSVPSTSDEETSRRRGPGQADTSTLESVQMVDRAKSFEYIPGESFPLQENSSSYEYLPGKSMLYRKIQNIFFIYQI